MYIYIMSIMSIEGQIFSDRPCLNKKKAMMD